MKLAVRAFVVILFFLASFFFLLKTPVLAQGQTLSQPANLYVAPNTNSDVPANLHTWTQNVLIEVMSAMTCQLAGIDPTNPSAKCLGVDQKTGKIGYVENGGGAIGVMGNLITMTLIPPVHTSDYVSYLTKNFGIAKPAFAQKSGLDSLKPLVKLWTTFRDIAYLLFVFVFVIIGIGIMLRIKIDPRTVMTIQNQIPKIIISLLLVTFSLAIAGILIDAMWIIIYLFINVLAKADPKMATEAGSLTANLNSTTLNYVNNVYDGGILGVALGVSGSIVQIIVNIFTGGQAVSSSSIIDIISNPIGALLGALIGGIAGILAFFIISIALLWAMFKLWFALLQAYVFFLVDIIFAPFWIVAGLIPGSGQSAGFSAWIRDMLGNLAAFPVAIGMFLLGKALIDAFGTNSDATGFLPPLVGTPTSSGINVFGSLIAMGIIFTTPHVVSMVKAAVKAPKINLGPIGESVGAGQAVVGGFAGGVTGSLFKRDQYGNPLGPGSVWMSKHVSNPIAKTFLGMNYKRPETISRELRQHEENVAARKEGRVARDFAAEERAEEEAKRKAQQTPPGSTTS